jgi:hypothetical protein
MQRAVTYEDKVDWLKRRDGKEEDADNFSVMESDANRMYEFVYLDFFQLHRAGNDDIDDPNKHLHIPVFAVVGLFGTLINFPQWVQSQPYEEDSVWISQETS